MTVKGLVLLIEDDDDLREVESGVLERAGFRVVTAREGREALDVVEREMPKLIFLDMRMPGMDGWAFAREFRARHGRQAQIVVITAAANAEKRAEEIAADGALGKPFEARDFIKAARSHLAAANS
jgi:CheY-like chemotaxis protein